MIQFLKELLKDKEGNFSLREAVVLIFVAAVLVSWIARQFFDADVPEYMFYSFVGIISAGCFGYSIEKKAASPLAPLRGRGEKPPNKSAPPLPFGGGAKNLWK